MDSILLQTRNFIANGDFRSALETLMTLKNLTSNDSERIKNLTNRYALVDQINDGYSKNKEYLSIAKSVLELTNSFIEKEERELEIAGIVRAGWVKTVRSQYISPKDSLIQLKINKHFEKYSIKELVSIFNYLKQLIQDDNSIKISNIAAGSVNVTFSMSEPSFFKLITMIDNEKLKALGVDDITFVNANKETSISYPRLSSPIFRIKVFRVLFKERVMKNLKIGLNELKNALFSDSSRFNELITIIARFNETEKKYRIGELSAEVHSFELSKLTTSVLEVIDLLEEQDIDVEVVQQNNYRR